MATAISMYYMSQQIGIALGISITSSLLKQQFQATLQKMLVDVSEYKEVSPTHHSFQEKKNAYYILGIDYQKYLNGFFRRGSTSYTSQITSVAELSEQFLGCARYDVQFHALSP